MSSFFVCGIMIYISKHSMDIMRKETRNERYAKKALSATKHPVSIAIVNFQDKLNVGLVIRAAACFGATSVHVIGSLPSQTDLKFASCGTCDYITLIQHSHPRDFLKWVRENDATLFAAELHESAVSIWDVNYCPDKHTVFVVGNESSGVPTDIILNSVVIEIPMPGPGFCLNTSQVANILLFDYLSKTRGRKNV